MEAGTSEIPARVRDRRGEGRGNEFSLPRLRAWG